MKKRTIYDSVEFDDDGFKSPYLKRKIRWKDVIRVAYVLELYPDGLRFENFWAFQTSDPELLLSVKAENIQGMRFSDEITRRYNVERIPAPKDWIDKNKFGIYTFCVYPQTDVGKPLYKLAKKHWWSLDKDITYAQI